jgi:hypothetical protein
MDMNYEQLTAQQALKIATLEAELQARKEAMGEIHLRLVCVGGPLNDNRLGFNGPQLNLLQQINNLAAD